MWTMSGKWHGRRTAKRWQRFRRPTVTEQKERAPLRSDLGNNYSLAFTPDGKTLVVGHVPQRYAAGQARLGIIFMIGDPPAHGPAPPHAAARCRATRPGARRQDDCRHGSLELKKWGAYFSGALAVQWPRGGGLR